MTHVLTIASLKGGTGKTTSAILLATALVRRGHTVTVIDTDPKAPLPSGPNAPPTTATSSNFRSR
ncbi:ParA family protein [Corynebacterium sp. NML130628]|uniref:ParA family protein n=1 Tax=Corynebacterium sp. NML130628 TaxID=1906333 RepID=UPI0009FB927C|nr:ParA family protein [Corynebacterium sp. NML130628]